MKNMMMRVWLVALVVGMIQVVGLRPAIAQEADDRAEEARLNRLERQVRLLAERQERMPARVEQMPGCPMPPQPGTPAPGPDARWGCRTTGRCPLACLVKPLLLVLGIIHVCLAVWVFTDIRKRGEGSGLFIVLALLAGIPGTMLYALVRIGDRVYEKRV